MTSLLHCSHLPFDFSLSIAHVNHKQFLNQVSYHCHVSHVISFIFGSLQFFSMLSLMIIGFFASAAGNRVRTMKPGSTTTVCHAYYSSSIQCSQGSDITAEICIFSPATNSQLYPDNTVVFIIGNACIDKSTHLCILIDANHMVIMPGDPSADDYNDKMPDFRFPVVIAVGHVLKSHQMTHENHTEKEVNVSVSDYVRGSIQHSTIQYVCYYNITKTIFLIHAFSYQILL